MIYLIGSLRNPEVPKIGNYLRSLLFDVFDSWYAPGPNADDYWRDYEKHKGLNYREALRGPAAQHIFSFDKSWLDRCDAAVMVMPAGKSCHMELGYMRGQGKPAFILFDQEPERFDVMHNFATDVFFNIDECVEALRRYGC
jgi:nucleoside 2-deoxyribosyltransferase